MSKISSYSHESHRPRQTQTVVMTVHGTRARQGYIGQEDSECVVGEGDRAGEEEGSPDL